MRITGTALKLGVASVVLALVTAMIVVIFGQIRFDRTTGYSAIFSSASNLRKGQFVRAAGVEVGKVTDVKLIDDGNHARVDFNVRRSLPLYQRTTAAIRYLNLIGDRYLELERGDSAVRLAPGATIPVELTQPALDLDSLVGSFQPLFRALDPAKVNRIASSLITIFQGEGGTIDDLLDQTAQLTSALADRDHTIGDVIGNLNTVLRTVVTHQTDFDHTISNLEVLIRRVQHQADPLADAIANISNAAGTVGDLLSDNRGLLHDTLNYLEAIQQPTVDQRSQLNAILSKLPSATQTRGRAWGTYGDFFNLYICGIKILVNGLQPGGPVRTVQLTNQPTGRCTPQ
ncbi:MCE family protein [Mycobacterium intracellulare]|uniref:MCE family protein n=1 Tax=Mycobacterium intracellulare TaxID=1767 RepID=UPI001CDA9A12|nr:MlaD family protein [Mycobacterium intracellulare]MCA2255991.1 MCE family protein [Mycobacterium intracellulare]